MSGLDFLSVACGFVTLQLVGGRSLVTLGLTLAACLGWWLRGTLHVPRTYLFPMALLGVVGVFLAPLTPPAGTGFIGVPSFKVAVFTALMVVLGMMRRNGPNERIILLAMGFSLTMACGMTAHREPYVYLVGAQLVLFTLALRPQLRWLQALFLLPVLSLALGFIFLLGWSETQLNEWLQNFDYGINTVNFPNSTRLSSLRSSQTSPMLIARVFSDTPPAYLVGRTYVRYHKFTWDVEAGKQDLSGRLEGQDWVYDLGQPARPAQEATLELSSNQAASLLLPRDAFQLRLPCRQLTRFGGGSWQVLTGDTFTGSYRIQRVPGRFLQQEPLPDPSPFLQLPKDLSPVVAELAARIGGDQPKLKQAGAIESWFHDHFEYGYGYPFDEQEDPVHSFLTKRPPAHCELFACSMALMLRTRGIPSRYVVGFLVRERSPLGGYSVVRARDAHAWVEAYLEPLGWVQFDPTPPQATAPTGGLNSWLESFTERLLYYFRRIQGNPLQFLRELLPWALAALTSACLLVLRRRIVGFRWLRRPPRPQHQKPPPEVERLHALLERFERQIGQRRPDSMTLLQWGATLDDARFVEDYCRVRYGQAEPSAPDLQRLESYLAATTD